MSAQENGRPSPGRPSSTNSDIDPGQSSGSDRQKAPTQLDRVLGMLLESEAVCGSEFFAAYIPRFSVHIHLLRRQGYGISKRRCDLERHDHAGTAWLYSIESMPHPSGTQLSMLEDPRPA